MRLPSRTIAAALLVLRLFPVSSFVFAGASVEFPSFALLRASSGGIFAGRCNRWTRFPRTFLLAAGKDGGNGASGDDASVELYSLDSEEGVPAASDIDPEVAELKSRLLSLGSSTKRGFEASNAERDEARDVVFELARRNPTAEPVAAYYEGGGGGGGRGSGGGPTLAGKWTLVYTDAPDITGLGASKSPIPSLSAAKLGRIGQECDPPLIKNVIEWLRPHWVPDWAPFSGDDGSRVLQKVCTEGKAEPGNPKMVDLKIVGLDLVGESESGGGGGGDRESYGPASLLEGLGGGEPIEVRGILTLPFGQFEVLYLDEEMRIIKTGQNFLAVNVREDEEWF